MKITQIVVLGKKKRGFKISGTVDVQKKGKQRRLE